MAITTFAAIDIGSYEVSMKIFELSKKIGFRQLNDVRYRLEIGKGAYSSGRLEPEIVDSICMILNDFSKMMKEFGVSDYRACATSAFREMINPLIVQEQIYCRTGIRVEILSNAAAAFPWLQIYCGKGSRIQKNDPEGNGDPGRGRRRTAGVSV